MEAGRGHLVEKVHSRGRRSDGNGGRDIIPALENNERAERRHARVDGARGEVRRRRVGREHRPVNEVWNRWWLAVQNPQRAESDRIINAGNLEANGDRSSVNSGGVNLESQTVGVDDIFPRHSGKRIRIDRSDRRLARSSDVREGNRGAVRSDRDIRTRGRVRARPPVEIIVRPCDVVTEVALVAAVRIHREDFRLAGHAGDKSDPTAVGREGGEVGVGRIRQAREGAAVRVHGEDLGLAVARADEDDVRTVGRPRLLRVLPRRRVGDVRLVRAVGVHQEDLLRACAPTDEGDARRVGRPDGRVVVRRGGQLLLV